MTVLTQYLFLNFKNSKYHFIFLLSLLVVNLYGQNKKIETNKRSIKTTTVNYKKPKFSSLKRDLDKVPLNFKEQNPVELYEILKNKSKQISKNEFETTQQFEDRLKSNNHKPIIGDLNEDSLFIFKPKYKNIDYSIFNYNADSENLELAIKPDKNYDYLDKSPINTDRLIVLNEITIKDKSYNAVNAFGVSTEIHSTESKKYYLAINNWNEFFGERFIRTDYSDGERYFDLLKFNFKVEPKIAKQIKENDLITDSHNSFGKNCQLSSLYIGKIIRPFSYENTHTSDNATLSKPFEYKKYYKYINFHLEEIWIYNKDTGEVYIKIKQQL